MPANTSPIFLLTGNFLPVRLTTANTASDGSGTLYTVVTAGANGSRVDGVRFINSQATAAASSVKVFKIFLSDAGGANPMLIGEVTGGAATRSVSAIGSTSIYSFDQPIIMQSGQIMTVTQTVYAGAQDQVDALAFAGNY